VKRRDLVFGASFVAATAAGEAIGLTAASLIGAFVAPLLLEPEGGGVASFALSALAGAIEGAIVGALQVGCLAIARPGVLHPRWVVATAAGMGIGWLAATLAIAPFESDVTTVGGEILLAGLSGIVLGAALGTAQWLAAGRGSPLWIAINAVAWPPALLVSYFGASAIEYGDWRAVHFLELALTGALVGLTVGALTAMPLRSWRG
jgi:hypothetical protein